MARLQTPDPLTAVALVFRSRGIHASAALDTTTAFLDAAVEMELCKACTFSSLCLLDRIWDSSLPETHPSPAELGPGNGGAWSRRKYLRTDRHYRRFQFRRTIVEAVKIEDASAALRMVPWLCAKFHGCIVPVTAVHTAAGKGNLDVLKFFKAIEIPARRDGGAAMRDEIEADMGHVVRWGRHDMEHAPANKQYETITRLYQNTCAPRAMKSTLMTAVHHGEIALLEWFRHVYRTRGFDPDTEEEEYELTEADRDREDLDLYDPFGFGNEGALTGENVGELLRGDPEEFMRTAVFAGRLDVLTWMVQNGYVNTSTYLAARPAVDTNRLDIVEFLIGNKLVEAGRALRLAIYGGKFAMARQLHAKYWANILSSHYYPVQRPFSKSDGDALWISPNAMIAAIERGNLESVQWLVKTFGSEIDFFAANQLSLSEKKRTSLDTVARRGELPLLSYLHKISVGAITTTKTNGQAKKKAKVSRETSLVCTTAAMDQAAANNHLEVVKWLHSKRTEGCTTRAMALAAAKGHLEMVKWLSTHRSEGCTASAMDAT